MQKYHLSEQESMDLLKGCECGVLCTNGDDGFPYGTPVNYVVLEDRIFFHGRMRGTRVSNMLRDPRCSLTVTDERGYQGYGDNACDTDTLFASVIVKGTMCQIDDNYVKTKVLRALIDRLTPERASLPVDPERVVRTGVYEVIIKEITGKYRAPNPESVRYPVKSQR